MKKVLVMCGRGVGLSLSLFVIIAMVIEMGNGGELLFYQWTYSKMAIGSMIIGIGFSVPSLVYENANLPYATKVLIHMGSGSVVFIIVSSVVGWIPFGYGWKACVISIASGLGIAFLLWFGFSLYYKNEAKKLNERLKQIEQSKQ